MQGGNSYAVFYIVSSASTVVYTLRVGKKNEKVIIDLLLVFFVAIDLQSMI
jgi:hypothetical protein